MKKTLLVLIAVVVLFAVLYTAPQAQAAEANHPHGIFGHCVCGGAVEGHSCEVAMDWIELSGEVNFGQLSSGYYYLTGDVTSIAVDNEFVGRVTQNSDGSWTCTETRDVVICLNGYTITADSDRTFKGVTQGSSLTITDCSYDPTDGTWDGTVIGGTSANGGIIYTYAKSTFNIYGGNFTAKEGASNTNGGLIVIAQDRGDVPKSNSVEDQYSTFNLYNGHFYGGNAKYGGNFNFMHDVHVNIYGGLIENGTATANGGNMHVGGYVVLNIQGTETAPVVIRGGSAVIGGNVNLNHTASLLSLVSISNAQIYGGTASTHSGNLRINASKSMPGLTMYDCAPEVAAVWSGNTLLSQHATVAEAADAVAGDSTKYVRMMADCVETGSTAADFYIDLAGYDVSGLTCTGAVYGMDSTTDGYNGDNAGSLTITGTPQKQYKSNTEQVGIKRYLAIEENGSYSFHRFYLGVTTVVLSPDRDGMGYKACFAGTQQVKDALQDYGMAVSFDELSETLEGNPYRIKKADNFTAGEPFYQKLIVQNILKEDVPENHDYGTTPIYARCFIRLDDGTTLFSTQVGGNMRDLVEQVDDSWSNYTLSQKWAVYYMLADLPLTTSGWGVTNAHHFNSAVWKQWTGTWSNGGHYYLTADYTLTSMITVPAGQTLNICLNGHEFKGNVSRLFRVYGTLNIHDHAQEDGTYAGSVTSTYATPVMAPVFYVYENGTMNLCGGNLKYAGSGVMTRGGVGMVGSDDTSYDSNTTQDPAYFNMYYGTISGGKVQAVLTSEGVVDGAKNGYGGNLDMVNAAQVTLYRGSVTGGVATAVETTSGNGQGGNISVSNSACDLYLYDVDITGGSSGIYQLSGNVHLNGDVNITGNQDYNLFVTNGETATTGKLENATVGITTASITAAFTTVSDDAYADCFIPDAQNVWVVNNSGALSVCHGHCVCGKSAQGIGDHQCEGIVFKAISDSITDMGKLSTGHYYLTKDVTVTGTTALRNKDVSICLNGYSIKTSTTDAPLGRVRAGGVLNICDCSGHQDDSGNWSWDGSIYAGNRTYGGVTNINANGKMNVYGGNFIGSTGNTSGGIFNVCNDGYAYVDGIGEENNQYDDIYNTTLNIYNGNIQGGTVTDSGGVINCWHKITVNIHGGTLTGGTAADRGGSISASGTITIGKDAVITGGNAATHGGNIYIPGEAAVHISGKVTGGNATERGGNVYMAANSDLYVDGGTISGGSATMGGGVFNYMATIHVSGNTVIDGNSNYNLHQFLSKAVDVGTLGSSAKIGIYSEVKGKLLNSTSYNARFYTEDSSYALVGYMGNTMYLPKGTSLSYSSLSSFSAGFGEADISPTENGVPLGGYGTSSTRLSTEVDANGRLYVKTTAVTDKSGNTILIVTCDQIRFTDTVTDILREHMSAATGVPAANIYVNCSHTHSVPDPATTDDVSLRYRVHMYNGFVEAAIAAMKDRKAATMQTGSFEVTGTDGTGTLNYVRHYQYTDSSGNVHYFGDNFGTAVYDSTTKHVSEADPTMFLIKFVRSGTDILLVNWRAHPHFTGGTAKTVVSSDYVGPFRDAAEDLLGDYHVAFIQGAAGNINEKSRTQLGDNHGLDYIGYGQELAKQLKNNMSCLKTVSTGTIQTKQIKFTANVDHDDDGDIENARLVSSTYWDLDTDARKALLAQYGYSSVYHAGAIIARYNMADTREVEINVFSIGDQVGFFTVPGELWDSAGVVVEEASPFPITICMGYCLGDYKYFTYGSAWTYESYETANYRLTVPDTIYSMLSYWKTGLKELYDNA